MLSLSLSLLKYRGVRAFLNQKKKIGTVTKNNKYNFLAFVVGTISYLELHCSLMLKVLRFETSDEGWFFVLGVLNAKNSAFRTPNASALIELYR